jgi:hypothetical protein
MVVWSENGWAWIARQTQINWSDILGGPPDHCRAFEFVRRGKHCHSGHRAHDGKIFHILVGLPGVPGQ